MSEPNYQKTKIQTATESFVVHYPEAIEFADKQWKVFWMHNEVKVEKDIQDILINMTEAERHGVITTLKLFTKYEMIAGDEYWTGRFMKEYPRPEFARMASVFGAFELSVHLPFYNKINELLHLNTDDFYNSYVEDETLKSRMDFIDEAINHKDPLISLGVFSLVEGGILYSAFSFLKHFQSQGKNKIVNTVRGINFSVRDENIHSLAGAWTFKTNLAEKNMSEEDKEKLHQEILARAKTLFEHESRIIDMIFEKGPITGITSTQMKNFVQSRINECMHNLGYPKVYEVKYNPIAEWFYDGITGYSYNDNFSGISNQYHREWDESEFIWSEE